MGSPDVPQRTENNKHCVFSRGQKDKRLNTGLTEPQCLAEFPLVRLVVKVFYTA